MSSDATQVTAREPHLVKLASTRLPVTHLAVVSEPLEGTPHHVVREVTQLCDGRCRQPWPASAAEQTLLTSEQLEGTLSDPRTCRACASAHSRLMSEREACAAGATSLLDLLPAPPTDVAATEVATGRSGAR